MRLLILRSDVVVDAEPVLHVGAEILHHHVGLLDQALEGGEPLRRFEVERHAALVALQVLEVRRPGAGRPAPRPSPECGGVSILMTLAPQSASWRTQVGPDRTRVRSRTVKRERAWEALENGISTAPAGLLRPRTAISEPDLPRSKAPCPSGEMGCFGPLYSSFGGIRDIPALKRPSTACHMTGTDERPDLGFAGCVHETL